MAPPQALCPPNDCPIGLHQTVARHDERIKALVKEQGNDHKAIIAIGRKIDRILWGVICVLLAVIAQIVFKH